ncbi:PAS domain S-box protein [Methanoculleus sp. FWC-SCC1]|uniref:histidine kinase n=1 Tax=Methanoculleus frigidifontis TaxID=2584085 RepID=A0ABT8M6T2_9EURY|nr:PAS domain S-box protein [Methanoculleus sp. FWC-SCC1]MDN7023647.1 PAS domain S-box protein [Methanoculleus sp. FWC-SCC1]
MVPWYELLTLLFFIAAAAVALLGAFVLGRDPGSRLHQVFFLSSITGSLWAFSEFMRLALESPATAAGWAAMGAVWPVDTALALHFILLFTRNPYLRGLRAPWTLAALYMPAVAFTFAAYFMGTGYTDIPAVILLAYVWTLVCATLAWLLCIRYMLRIPDGAERRQARLIAIGITVPLLSGFSYLASDVASFFVYFELPAVTALWYTIFVGYAIWKYGLFVITPETTADTIVSTMNDGLMLLDDENRIVETNAALTAMLGCGRDGSAGALAGTLFADPAEAAKILSAVRTDGSVSDCETALAQRDGRVIPVSLSGAGIRSDDGAFAGAVVILRDIAERKMHENALRESNRKLALLSSITRHDLLNQVMVIRGYLSFASEDARDPVLLDRLAKCDAAAVTIQQQVEFTRDYQDLGQQSPVWQNICAVVEREAASFRNYPVTIRADTGGAQVYADPLFSRVVYNLIDNALRHGGDVTAITFSVRHDNGSTFLCCEDNGLGVLPEEKDGLFRWGVGRNTGHGLFLAREILAITGMTIQETGSPGEGARFDMRVPDGNIRHEGEDT